MREVEGSGLSCSCHLGLFGSSYISRSICTSSTCIDCRPLALFRRYNSAISYILHGIDLRLICHNAIDT